MVRGLYQIRDFLMLGISSGGISVPYQSTGEAADFPVGWVHSAALLFPQKGVTYSNLFCTSSGGKTNFVSTLKYLWQSKIHLILHGKELSLGLPRYSILWGVCEGEILLPNAYDRYSPSYHLKVMYSSTFQTNSIIDFPFEMNTESWSLMLSNLTAV